MLAEGWAGSVGRKTGAGLRGCLLEAAGLGMPTWVGGLGLFLLPGGRPRLFFWAGSSGVPAAGDGTAAEPEDPFISISIICA